MKSDQNALMIFDPVTGAEKPYPSHARQYRIYHGRVAWLVNPWTGEPRSALDIGTDVFGEAIKPPGETVQAALLAPGPAHAVDLSIYELKAVSS